MSPKPSAPGLKEIDRARLDPRRESVRRLARGRQFAGEHSKKIRFVAAPEAAASRNFHGAKADRNSPAARRSAGRDLANVRQIGAPGTPVNPKRCQIGGARLGNWKPSAEGDDQRQNCEANSEAKQAPTVCSLRPLPWAAWAGAPSLIASSGWRKKSEDWQAIASLGDHGAIHPWRSTASNRRRSAFLSTMDNDYEKTSGYHRRFTYRTQ